MYDMVVVDFKFPLSNKKEATEQLTILRAVQTCNLCLSLIVVRVLN